MCPSNLLIAPITSFFLYFNENLFKRNFALKLSVPSTIMSYCFRIFPKFLSSALTLCVFTFTLLLILLIFFFEILTLYFPTS